MRNLVRASLDLEHFSPRLLESNESPLDLSSLGGPLAGDRRTGTFMYHGSLLASYELTVNGTGRVRHTPCRQLLLFYYFNVVPTI